MNPKRHDGRKPDELRRVVITRNYLDYAEGSVLIELGRTRVICAATVEESVPAFLRNSDQGWVTAEYAMLPRATQLRGGREWSRGKVGGRTHEIQRLIGRSLRAVTDLDQMGERTIIIDCDVIQADGGSRGAAITGAFVALCDAVRWLEERNLVGEKIIRDFVAAVSVGLISEQPVLDLCYQEDSDADVDMNVVMTGSGKFVEVQGTAEGAPFSQRQLQSMLALAKGGIRQLIEAQRGVLRDSRENG
jgi:ribonuclease PH